MQEVRRLKPKDVIAAPVSRGDQQRGEVSALEEGKMLTQKEIRAVIKESKFFGVYAYFDDKGRP